ncbi:MAG: PorP/SprF family type IX secretion system membrane protein [Bacteroidota bacterium]|nr:PorP/SprF family type IX secretion system membrane protein [Bacteroidota bacterium]MDP4215159.1 PorP/SprF family type IX secretion system membrane protein [Bacteroidota bacterium]MDP4258727.1 PorP/SprF family type IX secretion system membrane protein [Bacteroidota bacterium]
MRREKKIAFLASFLTIFLTQSVFRANAQDLHFSQWFNSPLTTNPANTGFIPDADYRFGANFRDQWSAIMAVPYRTMSIWGDAQVFRNRIDNGWLGLGGVILRDDAGSGTLTSTQVYGSIAYHQMVGYASLITAGFNVGLVNKRINTTNLKFPDQFDGKFFNTQLPTSVVIDQPSDSYFDMQVGLNYAYFPNNRTYMNAGFSVQHVNQARESFFSTDPAGYNSRISPRYIGFVNGSFKASDQVIVNPMGYYTNMAGASEAVFGMNAQYDLQDNGDQQVIGGLYFRVGDAIIPMIGFVYKNIRLTFTYDVTTSSLGHYDGGFGAWEFSLISQGDYSEYNGNKRQSLCPTFKQ